MTGQSPTHEGDHTRPDTSTFSVCWLGRSFAPGGAAGWYWYDFLFDGENDTSSEAYGPYSTSELAYDAGLSKDC